MHVRFVDHANPGQVTERSARRRPAFDGGRRRRRLLARRGLVHGVRLQDRHEDVLDLAELGGWRHHGGRRGQLANLLVLAEAFRHRRLSLRLPLRRPLSHDLEQLDGRAGALRRSLRERRGQRGARHLPLRVDHRDQHRIAGSRGRGGRRSRRSGSRVLALRAKLAKDLQHQRLRGARARRRRRGRRSRRSRRSSSGRSRRSHRRAVSVAISEREGPRLLVEQEPFTVLRRIPRHDAMSSVLADDLVLAASPRSGHVGPALDLTGGDVLRAVVDPAVASLAAKGHITDVTILGGLIVAREERVRLVAARRHARVHHRIGGLALARPVTIAAVELTHNRIHSFLAGLAPLAARTPQLGLPPGQPAGGPCTLARYD